MPRITYEQEEEYRKLKAQNEAVDTLMARLTAYDAAMRVIVRHDLLKELADEIRASAHLVTPEQGGPMGTVILNPAAAAETVCHEEQLRIWANDLVGLLSMEDYLREDIDYSEGIDLEHMIMREIKKIVESAFDHPEARTIRRT